MGTQSSDGRRSDEICPGQSWTYTFEVTSNMLGAWPFHDHSRHTDPSVLRGLFGGIVVRPKKPGYDFPVPFPGDFRVFEKEILKLAGGRLQPR